jgi:uncharacterized membrane protein
MASWDIAVERGALKLALALARHWLGLVNVALAVFVALPVLAPLLTQWGYPTQANAIYAVYHLTCHQEPQRSYFLAGPRLTYTRAEVETETDVRPLAAYLGSEETGYKMAFCQRDLATYAAMLAFGLLYAVIRKRLLRLPMRVFLLLLVPVAVDGLTQLTGLRESTWWLRTFTGGLLGLAVAWLLLPELDAAIGRWTKERGLPA